MGTLAAARKQVVLLFCGEVVERQNGGQFQVQYDNGALGNIGLSLDVILLSVLKTDLDERNLDGHVFPVEFCPTTGRRRKDIPLLLEREIVGQLAATSRRWSQAFILGRAHCQKYCALCERVEKGAGIL